MGRGTGGRSNLSASDRFCVWVEPDLLPQHTMSKTRVLVAKSELNTSAELEISLRRLGYDVTGRVRLQLEPERHTAGHDRSKDEAHAP